MARIEKSIEVDVPVRTAYNQWTQFEEFPRFMEGVQEVRQVDDTHLHWRAEIAGKQKEWDAEITEQVPDQCIAWRSTNGAPNNGSVIFHPTQSGKTRITLVMDYDPEGLAENVGDLLGVISRRVEGDLDRFRQFIEQHGSETGEWRGEVHGGRPVRQGGAADREQNDTTSEGMAAVAPGSEQYRTSGQQGGRQLTQGADGSPAQGTSASGAVPVSVGSAAEPGSKGEGNSIPLPEQRNEFGQAERGMGTGERAGFHGDKERRQNKERRQGSEGYESQDTTANPASTSASGQGGTYERYASNFQGSSDRESTNEQGQGGSQQGPENRTTGSSAQQQSGQGSSLARSGRHSMLPQLFGSFEEPFSMMRRMSEEMDRILDNFMGRPARASSRGQSGMATIWAPQVEVTQRGNELLICADLPGIKKEDVKVEINEGQLIIEGERRQESEQTEQGYRRSERSYGHFYRTIPLPDGVDPNAAQARMQDGVLEVIVPAPQQQGGRRLEIQSGQPQNRTTM